MVLETFSVFIIFAMSVQGQDFFVATNGCNSNPGTETAPFCTIQNAANLAQPGDVITVCGGVIPSLPYEQPDGAPVCIGADYFGSPRNDANPTLGPFANPGNGLLSLRVW